MNTFIVECVDAMYAAKIGKGFQFVFNRYGRDLTGEVATKIVQWLNKAAKEKQELKPLELPLHLCRVLRYLVANDPTFSIFVVNADSNLEFNSSISAEEIRAMMEYVDAKQPKPIVKGLPRR